MEITRTTVLEPAADRWASEAISFGRASKADLSLGDLIAVLRRRRTIILGTTLVLTLMAALYCLFTTARYKSSGVLQVQQVSPDALGVQMMLSSGGGSSDALESNINVQTQANILQSDTLALGAIQALHMEGSRDFQSHWSPTRWLLRLVSPRGSIDPNNAPLERSPQRLRQALRIFHGNLRVAPVGGTQLVEVSYLSSDPNQASDVVNYLMKGIVDYTFQTRYMATAETSTWLKGQLEDLRKQSEDLQAKVLSLQHQADVYSVGTLDAQGREQAYSGVLQRLQQAATALGQAQQDVILKRAIAQAAKDGDAEMLSGLAGNAGSASMNNSMSLIQSLRLQEASVQAQLAEAQAKYGSAYPKIEELRANLAGTQKSIVQEVDRIRSRATSDYQVSVQAKDNTQREYEKARQAAAKVNDKAAEFAIVHQEADQSRNLYEDLLKRLKEAGILEGLRSSNMSVVDPGRVPATPSSPNAPLYLASAVGGGLFLGFLGALLLDALDKKIHSIDDAEGITGRRVFAATPFVRSIETQATNVDRFRELFSNDTLSPYGEAVRRIRTSLLFPGGEGKGQVILVTSSVPREGKTLLSCTLASVLAQAGHRVLLVDTDMRRLPEETSDAAFPSPGLSDLLLCVEGPPEIPPVVEHSKLSILSAGKTPKNPSELLSSKEFEKRISVWRTQYEFIVLDTAPVLLFTDAEAVSRLADVALLVSRIGFIERTQLLNSFERLASQVSSRRILVVMNGLRQDCPNYSSYNGSNKRASAMKGALMRNIASVMVATVLLTSALCAQTKESLLIGPADVLHVQVFESPELEQHVRVTDSGEVALVMGGDVKVAHDTPAEAAKAIETVLVNGHFLLHPRVVVSVEDYATQKVSVLGQVRTPGAYNIGTPRSIFEVLSLAGGLMDVADRRVVVQRANSSQQVQYLVPDKPSSNFDGAVTVNPGDTVLVPKAGVVYILGDVRLPGGYTMTNPDGKISALQLVARAGGTNNTAVPSHARLIRKSAVGYTETPLPLSAMQKGKQADITLQAEDIVYVPFSYLRNIMGTGGGGFASALGSAAVYRF